MILPDLLRNSVQNGTYLGPAAEVPIAATSGHTSPAQLQSAAEQFEASLMKELVAPLEKDSLDGDNGGDGDGGGDGSEAALAGFAREALARSLAAQGGLGIARTVLDYFKAHGAK